jgi:TfoX/Sxy family transcriptional regulator of competence genes
MRSRLRSIEGEEMPMKLRKSPQALIDLFASVMPGPPAVQRKMFGYPAGFINGNMFIGLFQDDMILRLSESRRTEFLKLDGAKIFEPMPGRPMREYVAVPPSVMANQKDFALWISRALEYGSSLKPKSSKSKKAGTKAKRPASSKKKK